MLVKEIMIKEVVTIEPNDTVFNASIKYRDKKVGCLIVVDKEICVGIVTERDLIERTICMRKDPEKTRIAEIMSSNIKTIYALEKVEKAMEIMKKHKIKKLPVVLGENIVGIITVTDISRARSDISKRFIDSWVKPRWR